MKAGDLIVNKQGSEAVITSYGGWEAVNIKFLDEYGYEMKCHAWSVKKGSFKNPYHPSVLGVGYFGVGCFSSGCSSKHTPEYAAWKSMLTRCYSPLFLNKHPTYRDCFVSRDWHNFQNFAEWFSSQEFKGSGYDLDKDLLSKGCKVYSESTCCLIPSVLNMLLINDNTKSSDYPTGVCLQADVGRFSARLSVNGFRKYLGSYKTQEDAYAAYIEAKEVYVREKAAEWRGKVDDRVLSELMLWTVSH